MYGTKTLIAGAITLAIIAGTIWYLYSQSVSATMKRNTEKLGELNQQIESLRQTRKTNHDEWQRQDNELSWSINRLKSEYDRLKLCIDAQSICSGTEKKEAMMQLVPTAYADEVTWQKIVYSDNIYLNNLHTKVCDKQINSPLCKDRELFDRLYHITEERLPNKQFYPILLGITNAESSLWLNFAKDNKWGTCDWRNNWGGIKWKINDDWTRQKDQKIPDSDGCYLYKFDSIEEYWKSKVNTVRFWYKWCVDSKTPIRCMSYAYVGNRYVAEESWIKNTSIFLD